MADNDPFISQEIKDSFEQYISRIEQLFQVKLELYESHSVSQNETCPDDDCESDDCQHVHWRVHVSSQKQQHTHNVQHAKVHFIQHLLSLAC